MRENIFTPIFVQASAQPSIGTSAALSAKNFCTAMQPAPQPSGHQSSVQAANPSNALNALNASDVTTDVAKEGFAERFSAVISGGGGVILIDLHQDLILANI